MRTKLLISLNALIGQKINGRLVKLPSLIAQDEAGAELIIHETKPIKTVLTQ